MANITTAWGSYSPEDQKKDKRTSEEAGGGSFWKPKNGRNRIRILPPKPGTSGIYRVVWQHFVKNEATQKMASINCPKKTDKGNLSCPVCDVEAKLMATGSKNDLLLAKKHFKAKLRAFANIIDLDNEDGGVQIFAFGPKVYEDLIELSEECAFWDPVRGYDVVIKKKGEGMNTEYSVLRGNDHAISEAEAANIMAGMHDLRAAAGGLMSANDIRDKLDELDIDLGGMEEAPAPQPRRQLQRNNGERRASARDGAPIDGQFED